MNDVYSSCLEENGWDENPKYYDAKQHCSGSYWYKGTQIIYLAVYSRQDYKYFYLSSNRTLVSEGYKLSVMVNSLKRYLNSREPGRRQRLEPFPPPSELMEIKKHYELNFMSTS